MKDHFARRLFLKIVGSSAVVVAGCSDGDEPASGSDNLTESEYEYIVIGSGAGGGPLAANLARQGHKVLLLEAGEDTGSLITYQVPAFHPMASEDDAMSWDFFVKHYDDDQRQGLDTKMTPKGVLYPRAGTLGGCTAHNAMITVYPHASDWDYLADLTGDESWRSDNMRRYFEILEKCEYLGKNDNRAGHGFEGWLPTNQPDSNLALKDFRLLAIVSAAAQAQGGFFGGVKELVALMRRDLNTFTADRDKKEGLYTIPSATHGGHRAGPREYILQTIDEGHPLHLKMNCLVSEITFTKDGDTQRATGVSYLQGKHLYRADPKVSGNKGTKKKATATREVIVSAGVFNTPQLLKLSGIGPREELEKLGIKVKIDLPGVGKNLQDRYEVGIVHELEGDFNLIEDCTWGAEGDPCLADWKQGKGVYTQNGGTVAIIKKSKSAASNPDLFVFGLPGDFRGYVPGYSDSISATKNRFTWAILKGHTENSAGEVLLASTDPRETPDIRFRYFDEGTREGGEDTRDLAAMVEGVKFVRSIAKKTRTLMPFGSFEEIFPGTEATSDSEVGDFVKNEAWGHHASCTCKIGADDDPMAVLDGKFKVRGTANLRVVDASSFPKIPGFFIVTSIYMISEKATDVLLSEIGEERKF